MLSKNKEELNETLCRTEVSTVVICIYAVNVVSREHGRKDVIETKDAEITQWATAWTFVIFQFFSIIISICVMIDLGFNINMQKTE